MAQTMSNLPDCPSCSHPYYEVGERCHACTTISIPCPHCARLIDEESNKCKYCRKAQ